MVYADSRDGLSGISAMIGGYISAAGLILMVVFALMATSRSQTRRALFVFMAVGAFWSLVAGIGMSIGGV